MWMWDCILWWESWLWFLCTLTMYSMFSILLQYPCLHCILAFVVTSKNNMESLATDFFCTWLTLDQMRKQWDSQNWKMNTDCLYCVDLRHLYPRVTILLHLTRFIPKPSHHHELNFCYAFRFLSNRCDYLDCIYWASEKSIRKKAKQN